jgi:hypothetical protein
MQNINYEIKNSILDNVEESQEIDEIKKIALRYGSLCHQNILTGLRNTILVKSNRDNVTERLTGTVKVDASRLKDFLFSTLSQNVRGQSIRNPHFIFVKELLNLRQDGEIQFISGEGRDGNSFVSVKDMIYRDRIGKITILEKIIISAVKGVLNDENNHSKVRQGENSGNS